MYANKPREAHWRSTIDILENVLATCDFGIRFHGDSGLERVVFSDADYAIARPPRGGRFLVGPSCARGHVCAGFRGIGLA